MLEKVKEAVKYGNEAWNGLFEESILDEFVTELIYSITNSNRRHIDDVVMQFLCNLAEDSMNGSAEAEEYYEAIMDIIIAKG